MPGTLLSFWDVNLNKCGPYLWGACNTMRELRYLFKINKQILFYAQKQPKSLVGWLGDLILKG